MYIYINAFLYEKAQEKQSNIDHVNVILLFFTFLRERNVNKYKNEWIRIIQGCVFKTHVNCDLFEL